MRITLSLDSWPALRDFAGSERSELAAAASLAELAGVDALRLSINEDLAPVRETDVETLRRSARVFELRMPVSQSLLKVPLSARPDRVVLVGERHDGTGAAPPVDARVAGSTLGGVLRSLEEAGLPVGVRVAPDLDAVRAVHALGVRDVELFTGYLVDLPEAERRSALVSLGDTARLASKLRLGLAVAGGLDDRNVREVLAAAPAAERVVFGRSLARRALLVGLDRAVRDFADRMRSRGGDLAL
ncbi:MAG: pyridoxine 5'-phosphate synthase [Spirochaetaceae bacterium]|nr:pyridoxine 5'-phosphate synthase [Myxococcales bacterium]MCB9725413.1 pyridoxine 5'-phosphate synthase [Spirochaetaceae bacterium]HPG26536.1 pyridoxine 5'-phosphate synthase [Myxococcota bacterium]